VGVITINISTVI